MTGGHPCTYNLRNGEVYNFKHLKDFCKESECYNYNKLKPKKKEQFFFCNISPRSSKLQVNKETQNFEYFLEKPLKK